MYKQLILPVLAMHINVQQCLFLMTVGTKIYVNILNI